MQKLPDAVAHLPMVHQGKVRDIYAADEQHLLIVTTDRLSAFDVILPDLVPDKGIVLTQIARFWFNRLQTVVPHHLADDVLDKILPDDSALNREFRQRVMLVKKTQPLPIEAVVRGYLAGSGWQEYQQTGRVCGVDLPAGLPQSAQLPTPVFTPATKAAVGDHDENIDFETMVEQLGDRALADTVRQVSLELYQQAAHYARQHGIIIADTKFEFGLLDGELVLIDEALTPDSSRFWSVADYQTGISPPSFDKQFVRDYLETLNWDKTAPGPSLPASIIEQTQQRYQQALTLLVKNA